MKKNDETIKELQTQIKELKKLAKPLQEWLIKYYNPMCTIIIQDNWVKVVADKLFAPSDN